MTHSIRRWQIAAVCVGVAGAGLAKEASIYKAPFEEARTVYEGFFDAVLIEKKICEEELARGVQQGFWSDADQREGTAWLEASFDEASKLQVSKLDPQSQVPHDPRWTMLKQYLQNHRGVITLNNPACIEFSKRIQSLDDSRTVAAMRMCEAALSLAEDIWLDAKSPGDLVPAVRAIDYVRRATRTQWFSYANHQPYGSVAPPRPPGVTGPGVPPDVVLTAMDFRTILGIPKPLLLPDPDQNPAAFWEMSQDWNALQSMKHRFVLRPRIASRFAELDARYRLKMTGVRQHLEQLISTNAPAAEFKDALRGFPEKPILPHLHRPNPSSGPMPGNNPSYRDMLARRPPVRMFAGDSYTAFAKWLVFKLAEESGDEQKLQIAAKELGMVRSGFTSEVAKLISERLSRIHPVEPGNARNSHKLEAPTGDPANDLIAALTASEDFEKLAEAWRGVVDGDANPLPPLDMVSPANWASIARTPGNSGLIDLREQATRQAIASIMQSPVDNKDTEPIATRLIEALEKAFSSGSKAQARRLLRLDVASNILPYNEHMAFRPVVELLPDPADPSLEQDKGAIKKQLRALLSQATSPAAAQFASEELKKVRR